MRKNIGLDNQSEDTAITGQVATGAYTPKDLDSDSDTGRLIVADAIFVTELVEIDFNKDTQRDPSILLQKVKDKMSLCNATPEDPNAIRFLKIIEDFKASNLDISSKETAIQQS